jgi:hypothetical protein
MTENDRKEVEILASELFHIHHKHNLTFKNCSSELREWYLLEADWLIKKGYSKRPQDNNICECGHPKSAHIYESGSCRTGKVLCYCTNYKAKFGKDNSGMVPDEKELSLLFDMLKMHKVNYLPELLTQPTGIIGIDQAFSTFKIWLSKFSQQPPKEHEDCDCVHDFQEVIVRSGYCKKCKCQMANYCLKCHASLPNCLCPTPESDYVGKCPECNKFGHIKLKCDDCKSIEAQPKLVRLNKLELINLWNDILNRDSSQNILIFIREICSKLGTSPQRGIPSVEDIEWLIIDLSTSILHYHDKEGTTTEEKVIHRARFKELATAIHNKITTQTEQKKDG